MMFQRYWLRWRACHDLILSPVVVTPFLYFNRTTVSGILIFLGVTGECMAGYTMLSDVLDSLRWPFADAYFCLFLSLFVSGM